MKKKPVYCYALQRSRCVFALALICLSLSISWVEKAEAELRKVIIGSAPNLWFVQSAIINAEGWDREVGIEIERKQYSGPATLLQAFAAGEVDGMENNLAAAFLAVNRGIEIQVLAGTFEGDVCLIGPTKLVALRNQHSASEAIKQFVVQSGRKLSIVTNPRGSLSDLTLRNWLYKFFPDFDQYVSLTHAGDQAQLLHIFLSGAADVMSAFAPLQTITKAKMADVELFISSKELMEEQPGGVLVLRTDFLKSDLVLKEKLASLYTRASQFIKSNPERARNHIQSRVIRGLLSDELLLDAIVQSKESFGTSLADMRIGAIEIHDLMLKEGYLKKPLNLNELLGEGK
jgi:ABC-type nitrate/sulfonate/bicarbonate transport system substrate-binding protein